MKIKEHQRRLEKALVEAIAKQMLHEDLVEIDAVQSMDGTHVRYICHVDAMDHADVIIPVKGTD